MSFLRVARYHSMTAGLHGGARLSTGVLSRAGRASLAKTPASSELRGSIGKQKTQSMDNSVDK